MFLFLKLPSAFFAGVRVREFSPDRCTASVPYKWFSQNPFRSTYFACLAMAAELSTGALAMAHLVGRRPRVSMLVTSIRGDFRKKATGITSFTCEDGGSLRDAIAHAAERSEAVTISATSTGRNESGDIVAIFTIEWSFKVKR